MLYNRLKKKRPLTYFQIKNYKTYVLLQIDKIAVIIPTKTLK